MVYESYAWKKDLRTRKRLIQKYNTADRFNRDFDATYIVIEKAIFYSAFIIRKLIDCKEKLSDEADNYSIHVKSIKTLIHIDSMNRWPEENSHDWKNEKNQIVSGRDVCNWLIHSYFFLPDIEESGTITNYYVSSDFDRNNVMYKISIDDWMKYIDFIASDDIVSLTSEYDEKVGDFFYIRKKRGKRKVSR